MDSTKTIKGITCEVADCEHHTMKNECSADTIKVTPCHAATKEEADCATFKKKF
jgi:hypothetical protein